MSIFRLRLAIFLVSLTVIGLELALMRVLSLRFWYYFAAMVIGVALLGFGSSGTMLTLGQARLLPRRQTWLCRLALALVVSIPFSMWASQKIPLDVYYLAWNPRREWLHVLAIEGGLLIPFLLAGGWIGLALMDRPEHINGHYAANLVGSGVGAMVTLLLMYLFPIEGVLLSLAVVSYVAGMMLLRWRDTSAMLTLAVAGLVLVLVSWPFPITIVMSPYKKLVLELAKPDTQVIATHFGPMGQINVVQGPAIHDAPPGMSLLNPHPIPPRILMIVDGDHPNIIYKVKDHRDWAFLDYTTGALPYHLLKQPSVLIVGAGGGAAIGLSLFHDSRAVVVLETNQQVIQVMTGSLAGVGGKIYQAPRVELHWQEPRGFLAADQRHFDLIQLPLFDAVGSSAGGVQAAMESYLYTVETFSTFFDHLSEAGLLSVTVYAKHPPRDELRMFDLLAQTLRAKQLEPVAHLAMIRSWETVTLLLSRRPWAPEQLHRIRSFSRERGFDLCYLPDLQPSEANQFHLVDQPYYVEGTQALVGSRRRAFLDDYLFAIEAPTDDRPYFHHFLRWRTLPRLKEQLKGSLPTFLELGTLLLVAALIQAVVLAVIMIVLPLVLRRRPLEQVSGKVGVLGYFALLGLGFMLLEVGLLHKLILYLSHPIYSAAVVIATFLVVGGLGSQLSGRWAERPRQAATMAAAAIVVLALGYLVGLDAWLALTQSWSLWWRLLIAVLTLAPLALAMGHLFPLGLRHVGQLAPALIPWAWAANGFASVIATLSVPLLAMNIGFSGVILSAIGCYAMAGSLFPHGQSLSLRQPA